METILKLPMTTVSGSYGYGWQQMKKYFLYLFLVIIIVGIADIPVSSSDYKMDDGSEVEPMILFLQIVAFIYWLLLYPVIQYGASFLFLKAARNQAFEIKEIFSGFKNYLNVVLAHLLVTAIIVLGFIMLIVPGIILACRLAFVPYLVMDRDMEPIKAVEKSWQMTHGHSWTIFGIGLLAIPIFALGLLMVIVGALFSAMWITITFAALYYAVELKEQEALGHIEVE